MAAIITPYGADLWMKIAFDLEAVPTNYYLAVCTGLPDEEIDGTVLDDLEPDDPAYARIALATTASVWGSNSDSLISNINIIQFATPTQDWGRVESYALCSAATEGEVICAADFAVAPYVRLGVPLRIAAGGISFGFASVPETISV